MKKSYSHQIIGLRTFVPKDGKDAGKEKTYDAFHDKGWRFPSTADLFLNAEKILEEIPQHLRWNLFYTILQCTPEKRDGQVIDAVFFDLDGPDLSNAQEYLKIFSDVTHVNTDDIGVIGSGNGFHFVIILETPIRDQNYLKDKKSHYKSVIGELHASLKRANLPGKFDSTIWDRRRILRLPFTENRKPALPNTHCRFIKRAVSPVKFDITAVSKLPDVKKSDQIPPNILAKYDAPDSTPLFDEDGCRFLQWCKQNPRDVSEPQWYAALSITARCNDGMKLSHEISKGHPQYCPDETSMKTGQALEASGPRTCFNINELWEGCHECKYFGRLTSPFQITKEGTIPTESTGFHKITYSKNGSPSLVPQYPDLLKFFERQNAFVGLDSSRMVQVFNGKHYEYRPASYLEEFAQQHFIPDADNKMVLEFRKLVERSNLKTQTWFKDSTRGKINFQNGVLDLNNRNFIPHSPEFGFRYVLPYNYDQEARAPQFENFLKSVTLGDESLQLILLEFVGYVLASEEYWLHKSLVLIGEGANGKSTFLNIVKSLIGDGNYACVGLGELNKEYNRQLLDGRLANISEETPSKCLLESSLFKELTGGGEVLVRSPYKDPYFIRNSAKMLFSCNELPDSVDASYGFMRRLLIIPFENRFNEGTKGCDPHIKSKLESELPGIFNLCLNAYKNVLDNQKFTASSKVDSLLRNYNSEINSVERWSDENVNVYPLSDKRIPIATIDLYGNYRLAMERESERPVTFKKFSRDFAKIVPDSKKRQCTFKSDKKKRGYLNLRLRDRDSYDDRDDPDMDPF